MNGPTYCILSAFYTPPLAKPTQCHAPGCRHAKQAYQDAKDHQQECTVSEGSEDPITGN